MSQTICIFSNIMRKFTTIKIGLFKNTDKLDRHSRLLWGGLNGPTYIKGNVWFPYDTIGTECNRS